MIYTYRGAEPPVEPSAWQFSRTATRTTLDLTIDGTDAETVWVTARWQNARGMNGPCCNPVQINLPAALPVPMPSNLRKAA